MYYPKNKFLLVLVCVFIICGSFILFAAISYQIAIWLSPPYFISEDGQIYRTMPIGHVIIAGFLGFAASLFFLLFYAKKYRKSFLVIIPLLCYSFSGQKQPCGQMPALNKCIVEFVKKNVGKKVGRGECWDLAAEALNSCGAKWDGSYNFGKEINYRKECVFAGDIIQFKDVKLLYKEGDLTYSENLAHHTAVVYEVKSKGVFTIADQNNQFTGKKTGTREFNTATITEGTVKIYRPQK